MNNQAGLFKPGVDIVEVSRINEMVEKWNNRFLMRVYTKEELLYCMGKPGTAFHLAGRFAAKEAIIKLLKGKASPAFKSIEISRGENGEPIVNLKECAADMAKEKGIDHVEISISHTHNYAVAFAVAVYNDRKKALA